MINWKSTIQAIRNRRMISKRYLTILDQNKKLIFSCKVIFDSMLGVRRNFRLESVYQAKGFDGAIQQIFDLVTTRDSLLYFPANQLYDSTSMKVRIGDYFFLEALRQHIYTNGIFDNFVHTIEVRPENKENQCHF